MLYYRHHKQMGSYHNVYIDILSDCTVDRMSNYILHRHMDNIYCVCVHVL